MPRTSDVFETHIEGDRVIETDLTGHTIRSKDLAHVIHGYTATLHSDRTSDEAKQHAREMIERYTAEKKEFDELTEKEREAKHPQHHHPDPHRIIGGLKAALKNEHVHGNVKQEIRNRLDELGVQHEN